jgi:hypothetical protein
MTVPCHQNKQGLKLFSLFPTHSLGKKNILCNFHNAYLHKSFQSKQSCRIFSNPTLRNKKIYVIEKCVLSMYNRDKITERAFWQTKIYNFYLQSICGLLFWQEVHCQENIRRRPSPARWRPASVDELWFELPFRLSPEK